MSAPRILMLAVYRNPDGKALAGGMMLVETGPLESARIELTVTTVAGMDPGTAEFGESSLLCEGAWTPELLGEADYLGSCFVAASLAMLGLEHTMQSVSSVRSAPRGLVQ